MLAIVCVEFLLTKSLKILVFGIVVVILDVVVVIPLLVVVVLGLAVV